MQGSFVVDEAVLNKLQKVLAEAFNLLTVPDN
jgi:hypothetical protein